MPERADTAAVFEEFQRRLRAFVSRRVRQPADVDDVMQEAFLRIHRHVGGVRDRERLHAWVFQIARNVIADHYRRRKDTAAPSSPTLDGASAVEAAVPSEGDTRKEAEEIAACLAPMMDALSPTDRQALVLTDVEGRTQIEAAALTGLSLPGMKSRVQRARRRLKALLLQCCHVDLDARGRILGYEPIGGKCKGCG